MKLKYEKLTPAFINSKDIALTTAPKKRNSASFDNRGILSN